MGYVTERTTNAASGVLANIRSNSVEPLPPGPVDRNRRQACGDSLRLFLETYFPETFELEWSPDHLKIINEIEDRVLHGGLKSIGMPRGSGKTSILLRAALWGALYGKCKFVSIVAANESAAVNNLNSIKTEINHNVLLAQDFPLELHCLRLLGGEPRRVTSQHYQGDHTGVEYSTRRIDFGVLPGSTASGAIISAVGITGAIRGQHKLTIAGNTARPDFVLVDDPQTKSSAASPSQCNKRHGIMMGDLLGMAGPGVNISGFCTCTVIYKGDLADRLLDPTQSPDWNGSRVSMIKRWPKWMDGWDAYNAIRVTELQADQKPSESLDYVRANYERLHEEHEVYWEQRIGPGDVSALQHAMDLFYRDQGVFASEYQNAPVSATTSPPYEISAERLARRVIGLPRARVPSDTKVITGFIDVQMDLLYYVIMAWTTEGRGYVIDYGACPDQNRHYWSKGTISRTLAGEFGDELETFIRGGLAWLTTAILENDYQTEDNAVLQVSRLAIDARWGESTHIIRKFVRESKHRARLHPSMGMYIGANSRPWQKLKIEKKDKKGVHAKLQAPKEPGQRELLYDANYWKSFAADRLVCSESSPKAIMLFQAPPHEHRMFAEHCAYEQCVSVVGKSDNVVTEWRQTRLGGTVENDFWDCLVGNCALASTLGVETHSGNSRPTGIPQALANILKNKKTFRGL
jgi:hypothetical protein